MLDLVAEPSRKQETAPSNRRARAQAGSGAFRIVVICSGNMFRSPLVEGFIRQQTAGLPVEVSSRGALDLTAGPPHPGAVEGAARLGVDISGHRSRPLARTYLSGVDLVLGFERAHVSRAVVECGAPREKTFTLLELVDLLEAAPAPDAPSSVERARSAVEQANQYRRPREGRPLPELADPLGESARGQRQAVRRLHDASATIVRHLFGTARDASKRKAAPGPS